MTVREMKHISQYSPDKTMYDRMTLYRECCLPIYTK